MERIIYYYVFKNILDNIKKEDRKMKNIKEYDIMKKEFLNGGK